MKKLLVLALLFASVNATAQNVGIGKTNPAAKLDIANGRLRFSGNVATNTASGIEFTNSDGTALSGFVGTLNDSTQGFYGFVGSGWSFLHNNKNGNIGLQGNSNPRAPLSFANFTGNKIALYGDANTAHYGLGVQGYQLQYYTDASNADHVFGYGSSGVFTENMRVTGTGRLGLGVAAPTDQLHTDGTVRFQNYAGGGTRLVQIDNTGRLVITGAGQTFENNTLQGVPDNGCAANTPLTTSITVAGQSATTPSIKISVRVNITHPSSQELRLFLIAPGGQILRLSNGAGAGANYTNTVFTDEATQFINTASSPFTGKYKPSGGFATSCTQTPTISSFAEFSGGTINPNGNWQLLVYDTQPAFGGALNGWEISFSGPESFTTSDQADYLAKFKGGNVIQSGLYENPSSKNIGIKTNTATYPLTLAANGNGFTQVDAVTGTTIGTFTNGSGGWLRTVSNDNLFLATNGGLSQMMLHTNGNINIGGTSVPFRKLEVNGTGRFQTSNLSPVLELAHTANLALNQNIDLNFRTSNFYTARIRSRGNSNNTSTLCFFTYAATDSAGLKERLTIDDAGNIGINTVTDAANVTLTVNSKLKITDGTEGAGKVMTSDAMGNATWATPGGPGYGLYATAAQQVVNNDDVICFCTAGLDETLAPNLFAGYRNPIPGVYRFDVSVALKNIQPANAVYPDDDFAVSLISVPSSGGSPITLTKQTVRINRNGVFHYRLSWMGALPADRNIRVAVYNIHNSNAQVEDPLFTPNNFIGYKVY